VPHGVFYLFLILAALLPFAIYFYPFISSSIKWAFHSKIAYEGRTSTRLPFRWVTGEGGGFVVEKPTGTLSSIVDSKLTIQDQESFLARHPEARGKELGIYGMPGDEGVTDPRTSAFRSIGLVCGNVGQTTQSDLVTFWCFTSDFRYSVNFLGTQEESVHASQIVNSLLDSSAAGSQGQTGPH
jgi:hypothetical protein